jgi:hypothetical protein
VTRIEHRLSQFADDTSLILDGSEKSLNEALLELDWYAKLIGLIINFTKTQVVWIGSTKYSNDTLGQNRNLCWGKTSFKLLGINFAWNTFIDKEENLTWEYFLSSPLWMNKTIKIENKPVFYEDWFKKGIYFVNDIMSEDGKFLSID